SGPVVRGAGRLPAQGRARAGRVTEHLEADGGRFAAETLRLHGVDTLFTLSGGHLFPLYDGCVKTGIRLVDTRHEQTATFAAEGDAVAAVAKLVDEADRPVLMVGADVFWASGEDALRAFAEAARVPVFANGLGRGLLPADHELAFSRVRGAAFAEADLVVVAGAPLDFRRGFGRFGEARV